MHAPSNEPPPSSPSPHGVSRAAEQVHWYFGPFTVWEGQRRIERLGHGELRLGSRAFDLLLQLLRHAGELVSKDELLSTVWAGLVVEEASVRVHMSLLRKALGEPRDTDGCKEWITTIPQRGYRFNGRVLRESTGNPSGIATSPVSSFSKLPVRLTPLIGREDDIAGILAALAAHRLVTIVGPGGIGKTSVAVAAAGRQGPPAALNPATAVAFVDLSPLFSPDHVLGAIARSLGAAADVPDPIEIITQQQAGVDALLLIDNCEHVLDSLASPIARLLAGLPGLRVLATSREPLRVPGEHVLRLSPLGVPGAEHITLDQAMDSPSVKLLVERAKDAGARTFDEPDAPLLARLTRQLDGIPLAIELVAARLGVQSVAALAQRLDDHMRLLSLGNRSAFERHKSLAAALDWSIALLSDEELRSFRRLSLFRGRFDVESALAVVAGDLDPDVAFDSLIALANKSLVVFDGNDDVAPYHLLDTTRSYAAALLAESNERPAILRRYVLFMLDLMKAATAALPDMTVHAWIGCYARQLDDVRFALRACLAEQHDAKTAAELITASAPLWFLLSQVVEYRDRVTEALALIDQQPEPDIEAATSLATVLVIAMPHTELNPDMDATCDRALAGALAVKSRLLELQARWGQCMYNIYRGEYATALHQSKTLLKVVKSWPADPASRQLVHRANAYACFYYGEFDATRRHCMESLRISRTLKRTRTHMVGVEPNVAAETFLALTLWIQGEPARALKSARLAVHRAQSIGHAVSLCVALYGACPVALWSGEFKLADEWVRTMMGEARRWGLVRWLQYAEWYFQGLRINFPDETGAHIREVSGQFPTYNAPHKEMLVTFCTDWVDDAMIARAASGEGLWCAAEVWRAAGARAERRGLLDEAEDFYLRALDTSRQQGAKAWEQRAASSLGGLWSKLGKAEQAVQLLNDTLGHAALAAQDNSVDSPAG